MSVPWRRIGSAVLDVAAFTVAVLAAPAALLILQWVIGAFDVWLDSLVGRGPS